jgi:hypothetical protein
MMADNMHDLDSFVSTFALNKQAIVFTVVPHRQLAHKAIKLVRQLLAVNYPTVVRYVHAYIRVRLIEYDEDAQVDDVTGNAAQAAPDAVLERSLEGMASGLFWANEVYRTMCILRDNDTDTTIKAELTRLCDEMAAQWVILNAANICLQVAQTIEQVFQTTNISTALRGLNWS